MKDQKSLKAGGDFLAQNQFGVAVVVVSTGMDGDTQKDLVLTEARAMVVREYLVENFGFDDSQLKTLGMGKQTGANLDADWGSIQILIYPAGTEIPDPKRRSCHRFGFVDCESIRGVSTPQSIPRRALTSYTH
jgi:hypothetical protein